MVKPHRPRATAADGLHLSPEAVTEMRARLPAVADAGRRGDHRRGAELRRRAQRTDGREHPQRGAAGARRLPVAGQRPARRRPQHADRARGRGRLPAGPRARRAAAARTRRCSRRTGSAPGSPGARCRRPPCATGSRPRRWSASRSWSSPTSTSCPRRAWPATPTSSRPPAGSGSGCWSGSRGTCSPARPPRRVTAAAERADWTPPTTLTAVLVPEAQVRPRARRLSPGTLQARRPAGAGRGGAAAGARRRTAAGGRRCCARSRGAAPSPVRPGPGWRCARRTTGPCGRARSGVEGDTEAHLPRLVLTADPEALADLRAQVLAPLAELRPATAEKLDRDAALVAAAPRPPRRDRGGAVRAPADRALPDGPAARAVRRRPRRPGRRAGADARARGALSPSTLRA